MRALWQQYGRDFYADNALSGRGVSEAVVETLFDKITGLKLKRFFDRYVRGTDDFPLAKLLARYRVGDTVTIHVSRCDELMTFNVRLLADAAPQVALDAVIKPASGAAIRSVL